MTTSQIRANGHLCIRDAIEVIHRGLNVFEDHYRHFGFLHYTIPVERRPEGRYPQIASHDFEPDHPEFSKQCDLWLSWVRTDLEQIETRVHDKAVAKRNPWEETESFFIHVKYVFEAMNMHIRDIWCEISRIYFTLKESKKLHGIPDLITRTKFQAWTDTLPEVKKAIAAGRTLENVAMSMFMTLPHLDGRMKVRPIAFPTQLMPTEWSISTGPGSESHRKSLETRVAWERELLKDAVDQLHDQSLLSVISEDQHARLRSAVQSCQSSVVEFENLLESHYGTDDTSEDDTSDAE